MAGASDPLVLYLDKLGLKSEDSYFANSGFLLGRRVTLPYLEMVLRFEDGVVLICDYKARHGPTGLRGAVSEFVSFVHGIERRMAEVRQVSGLLRRSGPPQELILRQKLERVLLRQGATIEQHQGESWLVYKCRAVTEPG